LKRDLKYTGKSALFPFLKRIFSYSFRYKKWSLFFFLGVLVVALVDAAFPLVSMHLIDNVLLAPEGSPLFKTGVNGSPDYFRILYPYAVAYLLLGSTLVSGVFTFIYFSGRIQEFVMADIRSQMFTHLQKLSFSFYDRSAVGWLMSRITSDTERVTELISWSALEVTWGILMIIASFTTMFIYNWKLALIVFLSLPLLIVVSIKIRMLILKYSRQARRLNSELTASFNENITGVEVNKSTVQEERAVNEFRVISNKMRGASYKAAYYSAMFNPVVIFIGSFAAALVIYFGGSLAVTMPPGITIGILTAFFSYATNIFEPILDISKFYAAAQGSISAGERIFSLLATPVSISNKPGAEDYKEIKGEIEFRNVSFTYSAAKSQVEQIFQSDPVSDRLNGSSSSEDVYVLQNFNLKINQGESVALVGETGGGKSTVINLICRFYEPTSGSILIDGIDYRERTIESLRSRLGVVLQTPHLFSGTIRENILYGRSASSDAGQYGSFLDQGNNSGLDPGIINALTLAGAAQFIPRLDEEVGEGGEKLSMGEKQLISFARAIYADPRIFIMDEATSSIDTLTEAKIQKGIREIIKGRTSIIIAHRLSTIKNCDRIIVIKHGKIVEEGTHSELIGNKSYYHTLYTS
jgi:ATP-binding cassette subfamily B protein